MADAEQYDIAREEFGVVRRGYDSQEVRAFLHEVASLVDRLRRTEAELRDQLLHAERRADAAEQPDEAYLLEVLGEETTRVLTSAREAAAAVHAKAERSAERLIEDATREAAAIRGAAQGELDRRRAELEAEAAAALAAKEDDLARRATEAEEAAERVRSDADAHAERVRSEADAHAERAQAEADAHAERVQAEADAHAERVRAEADGELAQAMEAAEAEREAGRRAGKDMVAEAQAVRERVLKDLAAKRKRARVQLEKLNAGRERLLKAYEIVRATIDEATAELTTAITDARIAADHAARRVEAEGETSLEALDAEVSAAGLADLPVARTGPGPEPSADPVLDEPPTEPEPTADVEPVPESTADVEPVPEPAGDVEPVPEPAGDVEPVPEPAGGAEPGTPAAEVQDLFARLRAQQAAGADDESGDGESPNGESPNGESPNGETAGAEATPAEEARADEVAAEAPAPVEASEAERQPDLDTLALADRDAALETITRDLGKRLKRVLADEQNEVLDLLRRTKPRDGHAVLPAADQHAGRWREAAADLLDAAAEAGAHWVGGSAPSANGLADGLAHNLVDPLRERVARSFELAEGDADDAADRVRALYREWKGQRLGEAARHFAVAAYATGVLAATPDDAAVRWVVDTRGEPCPDADDNALAGAVAKGERFPTGHDCPPAHPGCQCLIVPDA